MIRPHLGIVPVEQVAEMPSLDRKGHHIIETLRSVKKIDGKIWDNRFYERKATMNRPLLIGIAGPSCSGKTSLARNLCSALLPRGRTLLFSLDAYYHDLRHLPSGAIQRHNFDSPDSLDHPLLVDHLAKLKEGKAVRRPIYRYGEHKRVGQETVHPGDFVVVEGLYALYWEEVRALYSLKIYLDLSEESALKRRLNRDHRERGATEEFTRFQFHHHVMPWYWSHIHPTRDFADLILSGEEPIGTLIPRVLSALPAVIPGETPGE